jgi:hypothetical protein
VDILLPDVEGLTQDVLFTLLKVTVFGSADNDRGGQAKLIELLLAAGANPKRQIWPGRDPKSVITEYVRTVDVARVFRAHGVPASAFRTLPRHPRARL